MSRRSTSEDDESATSNAVDGGAARVVSRGPRFLSDIFEGNDVEEDSDDGEDIVENAEQDYGEIAELDRYDAAMLADDSESVEEMSAIGRRQAEEFMNERDARQFGGRQDAARARMPMPSLFDDFDGLSETEEGREGKRRRGRYAETLAVPGEDSRTQQVDLEAIGDMPLEEWLQKAEIAYEVKRLFTVFLKSFTKADAAAASTLQAMNPNEPMDAVERHQLPEELNEEEMEDQIDIDADQGTDFSGHYYMNQVDFMCGKNSQTLEVNYKHLSSFNPTLAVWLADCPEVMLELFNQAAMKVVLGSYPHYRNIMPEIFIRIHAWPLLDQLRELRSEHIGTLVKVIGVVTRRTSVLAQLKWVYYRCNQGCQSMGPFRIEDIRGRQAPLCDMCENGIPVIDQEKSIFRNYQRILLQEPPDEVPAGRVPRYKEIALTGDLVDCCRPGEKVEITGVFMLKASRPNQAALNAQQQFPVFSTYIEANSVAQRNGESDSMQVTEAQRQVFHKLAKLPNIFDAVVNSIAPSVYGQDFVKTALALSLFGGREKFGEGHRTRGDIHVLLVGDPGTAKSQCLKYIEKCVPRGVFTTGKGASAVGLTAAVQKDPVTKEWVLEGGALVLADRGVCMIDEFDKMGDKDRTSIHEAMEQQSISVSKAGIVTTLRARCAVIAAANPIKSIYDVQRSFAENVMLTDPIIQRFDILCILKDNVNLKMDTRLAKFVVASHVSAHPTPSTSVEEKEAQEQEQGSDVNDDQSAQESNVNLFSQDLRLDLGDKKIRGNEVYGEDLKPYFDENGALKREALKKYIMYAKTLRPVMQNVDREKISRLYVELRRESVKNGGIPIALRHLESITRMSEAHARIHLRESVNQSDVDFAISIMLHSFISAQKLRVQENLRKTFSKYLISRKQDDELLSYLVEEMLRDAQMKREQLAKNALIRNENLDSVLKKPISFSLDEFERRAMEMNVRNLIEFYKAPSFQSKFNINYQKHEIVLSQ